MGLGTGPGFSADLDEIGPVAIRPGRASADELGQGVGYIHHRGRLLSDR
jgi:hypothetical protein